MRDDNNSNYMEGRAIVTHQSDTGTQNDLSYGANGVLNSGTTHHIATAFVRNQEKL